MLMVTSQYMFDTDNVLYFKEISDEEKVWKNGIEVHFKNDELPIFIHGLNLTDIVRQMRSANVDIGDKKETRSIIEEKQMNKERLF